jgi:hypothetical protein
MHRPLYHRGKSPGTQLIGGWVDPRTGLDDMEKWKFLPPPGLELQPPVSRYTDCAIPAVCYADIKINAKISQKSQMSNIIWERNNWIYVAGVKIGRWNVIKGITNWVPTKERREERQGTHRHERVETNDDWTSASWKLYEKERMTFGSQKSISVIVNRVRAWTSSIGIII